MKRKKKIILLIIILLLVAVGSFIAYRVYQSKSQSVVDIDQVSNVKLTRSGSRYHFDPKVKLDRFQEVRLVSAVEQDQDLYFYLISQFSLFPKQGAHQSFDNLEMRMKDKNTQLYLISGQNINIEDSKHPEENHIEVKNYEKRRKLSVK